MTSKISKRAAGAAAHSSTAASDRNRRRVRAGLLASTALVAASMAASGAMAQTANPAGGGTISTTGGSITGGGANQGVQVQQSGAGGVTVTGVNLANTGATPTSDGLRVIGAGGQGVGLSIATTSTITSQSGDGVRLQGGNGENVGFGVTAGQTLNVTGINGLHITSTGGLFLSNTGDAGAIVATALTNGIGTGVLISTGGGFGGSLGNVTANGFATGVGLSGPGVGVVIEGGSINATTTGINVSSTQNAIISSGAAIVAPTGINVSAANGASVTTLAGGTINSTSAGSGTGILVTNSGGSNTLTVNVGAAIGNTTALLTGVDARNTGTGTVSVTNTAAITATGSAIYSSSAATTGNVLNLNADITGGGLAAVNTVGQGYTINVGAGATITASGTNGRTILMQSGDGVIVNNGTISNSTTNANSAIQFGQAGNVTNFGSITTVGSAIGISANTGLTLTNSGTIAAGGAGIYSGGNGTYVTSITNLSGGSITGNGGGNGTPAIALFNQGSGANILDLREGSTTGGVNVINGSGTTTVSLAGAMTGNYNGSSALGAMSFTLASTGSMLAATFGSANDTFNWQGGTIGGVINAGTGTGDVFNSALGAGISGSLNLSNLSNFDSYNHQSGNLTLTGSRATGPGWNLVPGSSLTLDGALTVTSGSQYGITMNGNGSPATVSILTGATLNAFVGVWFNTGGGHTFSNAGTVTGSNTGLLTNGGLTATNTGTITAGTNSAFGTGFGVSTMTNSGILTGGSDATAGFGVFSQYSGVTVTNNAGTISGGAGGILSGSLQGATNYGGLLSVTNAAGARISGPVAITTGGSSSLTLNNSGRVLGGANGGIVAAGSGAVSITNNLSGQIVGSNAAISTIGTTAITNAGLIGLGSVDGAGVYTFGGTGYAINLANGGTITNSGTIRGGGAAIFSNAGTLTLTNTGAIRGGEGFAANTQDAIWALGGTILNSGSITVTDRVGTGGEPTYSAINLSTGVSTVTNAAGGLLEGGTHATFGNAVQTTGVTTFNNYGSAIGGATVGGGFRQFADAASTINLHAGSTTGAILTGAGNDTLSIYSGRGTAGAATVDVGSGITLQNGGTLGAAIFGTADLGLGTNTLRLRGTGDGTAANGVSGTFDLSGGSVTFASILDKLDAGTWTLTGNGAGYTTINAGDGGGNDGLLILNGTGLTAGITINGATVRAMNAAALGTGLITMINPTLQFAATDNYTNAISLAASDPINDPTNLQTFGTGITATLSGAITQATAGQPLVFSSVDANGVANAGTFVLTNTGNSWTGQTRINAGTTLSGAYNTISGGSITNNGALIYTGGAGTVAQNITGSGAFTRNGTGALLLTGTNNWTGTTTITAGELRGATGSISGASIVNNGTLTYSNATAGTANQNISGSGAINIMGTGVTLAGAITTTGQLTVSGPGSSLILGGSRSGANNTGVVLSATGGSLTVANGASLLAGEFNGVRIISANSSVTNFGLLQNAGTGGDGTVGAGIYVLNGGLGGTTTVNNGSTSDTGAGSTIQGRNAGVRHESGSTDLLVVNNYGLIVGDLYNGVENTGGSLTVNNFSGGYITTLLGNGVSSASAGAVSVTNAGVIGRNIAGNVTVNGYGVTTNGSLTLNNQSGGQIFGTLGGVQTSGALSGSNAGTITGVNGSGMIVTGGSFTNALGGTISGLGANSWGIRNTGSALTLGNAGTISGLGDGISSTAGLILTNSGTISGAGYAGVAIRGGGSVTNSGTITGNGFYGIQNATNTGTVTITNQSGGVIGGAGSILIDGSSATIINLQAGSTTNGQIAVVAAGGVTATIAGTLNGAYNAGSTSGIDNLTLASTGSMTSASLGGGADMFTYQGGSFSGTLDGGTGTDSFASTLGGAGVATLSLTSITGFETFAHNSGQLTLTGAGGFTNGATVNGGTLLVNGTLAADTLVNSGATLGGSGTINGALTIANGGILTGAQGSDLAVSSLNLSSGSIINATFSGAGGPALFAIGGNLTLDGTLNVASSGAYGFGVYGLMAYGGVLTDNGLTLGTTPGGAQRVSVQTSVAGQINVVHAPTTLLFWDGGNAGQYNNGAVNGGAGLWTAAGSEWTDANGLFNGAMEPQPGFAIFQGTGGLITVDDVAGAVGVTGMQFAADGYSIQGDSITLAAATTTVRVGNGTLAGGSFTTLIGSELTGAGQLAQTDLGTLILTGENTYTGGTSIDTGRLQIGAGGTTGSILGAVSLANGGTLTFARSDNHVFNNAVSGTGSVNINGVVTLTGPITNTFGVNVGAGSIATLSNVSLTSGNAVIMSGTNATVNVANGGVVQSLNGTGIFVFASNGFIDNLGTISGSNTAVYANADLTLTNGASGSISGPFAVSALQNLNLTNNGSINATVTNFNSSGIYAGATGTILNTGSITSGTNAIYTQGAGSVTNSGLIRGGGAASTIRLFGANSIVTNQAGGEINTSGTGTGVYLDGAGSTVINAGTIRGANAVNFVGSGGTLTNSGSLTGISGSGVVGNGGVVTNLAGGSITGQLSGVTFVTAAGTVTNAGTIFGTTAHGVNLNAGGAVDNSGSITGSLVGVRSLAGLNLTSSGSISGGGNAVESVGAFNDTLTFLTGSTTTGSVLTDGGDDLISLAGSLTGSVGSGAGADTVTLFDTGSFSGLLDGGDGVDAFVLDGSGAGTVDIGTVVNFESRTMQGAGVFTLTGADTSSAGWAINAGVLAASGGLAIGDDVTVTIGANGTLAILSDEAIGSLVGSGLVDLGANTLGITNGGAYDGIIGGAGGLTLIGGTLTLSGANTYTGLTNVLGGTLAFGASDVLSDLSWVNVATGATLDIGAFNDTVGLLGLSGTLNGTGTLTASEYQLNGATVNANLGAGNLFQVSGVSTLNGTSASQAVSITGGTLSLGAADRLSDTATVVVASGAVLNVNAFNDTIGLLGLSGTLNGTGTVTAGEYQLNGATVNANLGAGNLFQSSGVSTLNGTSGSQAVSIAGGTLSLGASNRLSDTATVVVGSGAVLNLNAFNDTVGLFGLSGTLNGTGTLTAGQYQLNGATVNANLGAGDLIQVSGVSTLNGTSGSQFVSIAGGTLALGASNRLSDTATVVVGSGAVLNLNAFNDTVGLFGLSGTLNGTGTLTAGETQLRGATVNANLAGARLFNVVGESILNGTAAQNLVSVQGGTLRLGASERLSDTATVSVSSGATLAVGAWQERIGSLYGMGDVTIGSTGRLTLGGAESGFGGRLSGAGTLAHAGGLFTLLGDHTIANIVNQAGELRFLGSTTGAVSVTGGTLTGAGTIGGALTVSNGAVLSPGLAGQLNGIGGFTVGGLTLTGGRLNIDVTGRAAGSLIDQIRVLGTATLTGGTVAPTFQGPASGFDFSTRYLFLQANRLVGSFSNGSTFTAAAQDGLFWRVRYDLAPNSAVLELRQLTDFNPGQAGTENQGAVGSAFSIGQLEASDDYAAVLSILAGLSVAERNAAFDSVSGEALTDMTTSLFSANDHFMQTVQSSGGRGDSNSGSLSFASQLSLTADRASPASQLAGVLNAYDPGASMNGASGGWVAVFTGDQELEGKRAGQANVGSRHSGFAGGYGVSNGPWSFGGAAGVSRMEGDVVDRASRYETDLSHAAGYFGYDDGQWAADVTASVFGGEADTRRTVTVGAFSGTAIGDTHAEGQAIAASVARRFHFEGDATIALGVIGTLSNASVDGFTETGAGALSLTGAGLERDWQTLNISARASQPYRVNGRTMKVYGGMGVLLTTGDREATGDMRFSGAPTGFGTFTIEGAETPPLAGVTEFGLEVEAADGVSISAGYRGLFSERLNDNQIGMKLNVRW